ncbi:MAG: type IX secretion system protein PorQ [Saprospiraceae bacterium]|nr:type IX secretion system protein PorQ [Saprospiraceae bacterium]
MLNNYLVIFLNAMHFMDRVWKSDDEHQRCPFVYLQRSMATENINNSRLRKCRVPAFIVILLCAMYFSVNGQVGGDHAYSFLNLSTSARVSALGGSLIPASQGDLALAYDNPAILNEQMDGQVTFQHQFLAAGIQSGYAGFGKWFDTKKLITHVGFKYILYGDFNRADEFGNPLGQFKGSEVAINMGIGYMLYDKLRIGGNIKLINSTLDVYRSAGLAFDLGAIYTDTSHLVSFGISLKNSGFQLSRYDEVRESLPVDLQIGVVKRLRYLPFQLSIIYHHFNRWNLLYDNPSGDENNFFLGFQQMDTESSEFDNFFRHLIFGGELFLGKHEVFSIRLGYNHQRKQELTVTNLRTLTGFSGGFGLSLKKFRFAYSFSKIHFGATTHHLGLTTNIKSFTGTGVLN